MNAVCKGSSLLVSAAALILGTTVAAGAGGYTPAVVEPVLVEPVLEAPVGDWQGGYAGLTLGYAFGGDDDVGVGSSAGSTTPDTLELSGVNAGIRVGYRWQRDRWVFGPELGFEGGDIKDSFSTGGYDAESKVKDVLALRLKTGYVLDNDMLIYGIAGVASARVDYSVSGHGADIKDDYTKSGYVIGLGAEKKLTDRMSLTGEYEYANFGNENLSDGTFDTNASIDYHNIKLGLNFKF